MTDNLKKEAKYKPEYYIDDLENLLSAMMEKIKIIDEMEFSLKQKSQIAGMMMGWANCFNYINKKMTEWGFLS